MEVLTPEVGDLPINVQSRIPLRIATSAIATAGLGIISERHVSANEEIFGIPQPLVSVISDNHMKDTCDNCFLWSLNGLHIAMNPLKPLSMSRCNGCKTVSYCSRACQIKAWKSYHKAECKIYASNRGGEIPHTLRAIIRLWNWRASGHPTDDQFSILLSLKGHKDWWKAIDDGIFWSIVEQEFENIKKWTHSEVKDDVIEDIFCIFVNNSMSIHSPEGREVIGSCLDPFAALINHSCDPNSFVFFEGRDLRVRTMRAIALGEEITISYVAPNESLSVRQEQLLSKYRFTCTCEKCEKGPCWPGDLITADDAVNKSIQEAQNRLRALLNSDPKKQPVEAIQTMVQRICAEGYPGKQWPCEIPPMPDVHLALSHLYQAKEDWPKAFAFELITSFGANPLLWPSQSNQHRVQNFMNYVRIETQIANLLSEGDRRVAMLQPLKGEILRLQHPHGKRYSEDSTKAFGKDSTMAEAANAWAMKLGVMFAGQGNMAEAVSSYYTTKEGKADMVKSEKKLLEWAKTFVS